MAKFRVSMNWWVDVEADTKEEALDLGYEIWNEQDQDNDYANLAVARRKMRGE